jgi:hypothetical protein
MHPTKPAADPPAVADAPDELAELAEVDALAAGELLLLALELLLPHAAISRVAAPAAATVATKEVCLTVFLHWTGLLTPRPDKGVT